MRINAAVLCILLPAAAPAEDPLSAIGWLKQAPPRDLPGTVLLEPPVSKTALNPEIEVTPLEELATPIGLVPPEVTGLPLDVWQGSEADRLARAIAEVPVQDSPAMQTLLYTLLLSETRPPAGTGAAEALLLARIDRLMKLGAADPAQALVQLAGPTDSAARFRRWLDATLLTGDEDRSCAALTAAPYLAPDYAATIFCTARRGDWQTAALTLETAHSLGLLSPPMLALLDRFLSPDVFEGAPPLPAPDNPDPLTFRLFESIGERLPTAHLPRAFATADLRDVAGWKAQIEAAERLTRVGALSPNLLLGLYSDRRPAASGGVWDRAAAIQRFDTALDTASPDAVAKTLPDAWAAMQSVGLEVAFAELFADRLAAQDLDGSAAGLAWRVRLLSPAYEDAARSPPDDRADSAFLAALAQGDPGRVRAPDDRARAIAAGFAPDAEPPAELRDAIAGGALGAAILRAMNLFDSGARGNPADLSGALATFRAVGLEDTARRAALQLMLLKRT
ncbi:MAG: hypothetical protein ACK5MY_18295 [Jhaorihella sp.]